MIVISTFKVMWHPKPPNPGSISASNVVEAAEYRTVSGVAGPLVILEKVKVIIVRFTFVF